MLVVFPRSTFHFYTHRTTKCHTRSGWAERENISEDIWGDIIIHEYTNEEGKFDLCCRTGGVVTHTSSPRMLLTCGGSAVVAVFSLSSCCHRMLMLLPGGEEKYMGAIAQKEVARSVALEGVRARSDHLCIIP